MRGKVIDYSPEAINKLLAIVLPEECNVQRRKDEDKDWNDEKWESYFSLCAGKELHGMRLRCC